MSGIIKEPLDIMTKKDIHQLYELKGMLKENNTIDVTIEEMQLCHEHWPENFESLYDIGAKAFERFLVGRCHLAKLFNVEEIKAETWRHHFVLDRCVLHMLQMLHETFTKYFEEMKGLKVDEKAFISKLHVFGGRYRQLAPSVPVQEYFHLFTVWTELHMDFISLTGFEHPITNKERAIILRVWAKIINNIKVHFVYGWYHTMYTMTREEVEYFARDKSAREKQIKEKPAEESTRSRLIAKLTRLLSRESFSDASNDEKSSPTRKNSQNAKDSAGTSRARDSSKSRPLPVRTPAHSREEDIIQSQPIEICEINFDFLNSPQDCSPLNIANHF